MADTLTRENGFVSAAASDWGLMQAAMPMSIVLAVFGVASSMLGKWQMKVGPRKTMALASLSFGGGMLMAAGGVYLHSLPLLYLGYGGLGGLGLALSYTPPVQTLMQWFPDKKGIASGLTIAGFGSGAFLFAPAAQTIMKKFAALPEYLGPASDFVTKTLDGKLFADINGSLVEVVQAGASELAKLSFTGLSEGLYVVGTGSTGAAETLAVMSAGYFAIMLASSLSIYKPHPSVNPVPQSSVTAGSAVAAPVTAIVPEIDGDEAFKTKQFHLLGTTFFCVATGGLGMFSVAKPMMGEVFSSVLPALVTSAFAAKFVLLLSAGNLGGRLGWAAISDAIGRRKTFTLFTVASVPLYLSLPTMVDQVMLTGSAMPLYGFCVSTVAAVSIMGGVYAILPAYEADLFGAKYVGAIHGKMLLYSAAAALVGPYMLINLRSMSEKTVITDLIAKISPEKFYSAFGAPVEQASELLAAKTLSISKLMVLMPPGTIDPTPHIYDSTMYALGGLMTVAFVSHAMVRPLTAKIIDVKESPAVEQVAKEEKFGEVKDKEEFSGDRRIN
eukprot:gene22819-28992_t